MSDGELLPEQIQMGLVCAQAAEYAARNRARVQSCRREQYDILVEVRGTDELDQVGDTKELDGDAAAAKARATPWGFGGGGFGAGGGALPVGGGGGGSLMGADPQLAVYAEAAAKFGLSVSSGLRPGDSDSFHGSGNALDLAAPMTPAGEAAMLRFARYAEEHWGSQLPELIHTPLGYGIKNGQRVPLAFWGAATNAQHFNHVHIADTDPAKPGEDSGPPAPGIGGPGAGTGPIAVGGGLGIVGGAFGLEVDLVRFDGEGGRVADISGVPDGVPGSLRQVLFNIMICESSGDPHATEDPGGNGGPLGHYGLFQFDLPTWESVGGHGDPRDAAPEEQWMRAVLLYQRRGAAAMGMRRQARLNLEPVCCGGARTRPGRVRRGRRQGRRDLGPEGKPPPVVTVKVPPPAPDRPCNGRPGVDIPAVAIPEVRAAAIRDPDHKLNGKTVKGFDIPGLVIPTARVPAQCATVDPAPAACLGRVTIPAVVIPGGPLPAVRIPGVQTAGANSPPVVQPAVDEPVVRKDGVIEEQVCAQEDAPRRLPALGVPPPGLPLAGLPHGGLPPPGLPQVCVKADCLPPVTVPPVRVAPVTVAPVTVAPDLIQGRQLPEIRARCVERPRRSQYDRLPAVRRHSLRVQSREHPRVGRARPARRRALDPPALSRSRDPGRRAHRRQGLGRLQPRALRAPRRSGRTLA